MRHASVMSSPPTAFKNADREHTSVLANIEKRTLIHIAQRLPAWVNSDHLTGLGFLSLALAGVAYAYSAYNKYALIAVILLLILNWFGDSLDGTVARVRNKQRPRYGFYVDHILDAIGMFLLMCGLCSSGYITPAIGFAFLIAYLLLSIEIYLATYTIGKFHLSYWRFGPTELRILLSIGNVVVLTRPHAQIFGQQYLLFDVGFVIGTVALALILLQAAIAHTVQLYNEETK
jgi:archaetidylinositol phosphate synthase